MKRNILILLTVMITGASFAQAQPVVNNENLEWWRDARFGMFVHWGLYSVAAGEWEGEEIGGIGEWIQFFAQVPSDDYAKLANQFNPTKYNPAEWVSMAKDAGAKYVVLTTKHHEGFCLYPSDVSDFDIESTPYKGDPLLEFVTECRKQDMKVGFYYSHRQDWHEEDAAVLKREYDGHFGKPQSELKPDLDKYINEKALPQMRELLTRYGQVDLLWYDTPFDMTPEQSQVFVDVVRELQPNCLINGRVGYGLGDYGPLGDNEMPCSNAVSDLEMVATLNHTWGYKKNDHAWKDEKAILSSLIECASRGVNYMLNIGPKASGVVPQPSVEILEYIGDWMEINSEAIYDTEANPYNDNFPWGFVTKKENALYLHLNQRPQDNAIILRGIKSDLEVAEILGKDYKIKVKGRKEKTITLPADMTYDNMPVLKLTFSADVVVEDENFDNEGIITMPMRSATIIPGEDDTLFLAEGGTTDNFNENTGSLSMQCRVAEPGQYVVKLYSSRHWRRTFVKGAFVSMTVDGTELKHCELHKDYQFSNVRENSYPEVWSKIGVVDISKPGLIDVTLSIDNVGVYDKKGSSGEYLEGMSDNNIRVMKVVLEKL